MKTGDTEDAAVKTTEIGLPTPGPWHFLEAHDHNDEYSRCNPLTICSDANDDLAKILSADDSTVSISRLQAIANAHLIAASPELLAALKGALVALESLPVPDEASESFCAAIDQRKAAVRAAISKAEGR